MERLLNATNIQQANEFIEKLKHFTKLKGQAMSQGNSQNQQQQPAILKGFEKALNDNGYGFQHSLIKRIAEMNEQGLTTWVPLASEFPVDTGSGTNNATRIDVLLHRVNSMRYSRVPLYLIGECKRANPALSNWCFAKIPFPNGDTVGDKLVIERLLVDHDDSENYAFGVPGQFRDNIYHVPVEVRAANQTGPAQGHVGRSAIEDAATQICRGLNGFANFFNSNTQLLEKVDRLHIFPVIFTTANLWTTSINLGQAELQTGNINLTGDSIQQVSWLIYQYIQSPGLLHDLPSLLHERGHLKSIMQLDYIRSIAIVNPSGLEEFLRWAEVVDFR